MATLEPQIEVKRIVFTGHRDVVVPPVVLEHILTRLNETFPGAVWVHGRAIGFDSIVDRFAKKNGIETEIHEPEYERYARYAPLKRNEEMVDSALLVVAYWDGREKGGTYYTVNYATSRHKLIIRINPKDMKDYEIKRYSRPNHDPRLN